MSSMYKMLTYDTGIGNPHDGQHHHNRQSDMCMVFKYKTSKHVKFDEGNQEMMMNRVLQEPTEAALNKMNMWKQRRESILKTLQNCGLHVMCFYSRDRDEILVKIGATSQKLRDTAARMKYKLQLKAEYLNAYAEYRHDFHGRQELNHSDRRIVSHIYNKHGDDEFPTDDAIFTTLDKMFLINHIITSKDKDCAGINVGNLLHQQEVQAYFPIHEQHKLDEMKKSRLAWVTMGTAHANKVREYFGDRIAFYFLWMSYYWQWMIPLAIVGIGLQVIDFLCRTPDNLTAVPFCIFLSVWSLFLPHFWRRQEMKYAVAWGSLDLADELEKCRPEHFGEPRINPVTAQVENFYPLTSRLWHYAFSGIMVIFSGVVLVGIMCVYFLARHLLKGQVTGGTLTFQFCLAAVVEIVNFALGWIARKLTVRENHRTQSQHDLHMLAKVCGFKFVNSYFALYYIAFFKKHGAIFGTKMECFRNDCWLDLQTQVAMFVIFRLVISNILELAVPRIKLWYRSWYLEGQHCFSCLYGHKRLELAAMSSTEQQAKKDPYDAFADFDETLITHGYTTLFAVASPWVCLATLVGTILEIWIDAKSITETKQRPMPMRTRNNEPWNTAFDVYGVLAAFTNVFLLIFGSTQYMSWTFTEKLTLFLFLEHMIFMSLLAIKAIFPAVPSSVVLLKLKQDNIVHRCLENIKVEHQQDFSLFRDHGKEQIEIFERDHMDDDDAEPNLSVAGSMDAVKSGMMESLPAAARRAVSPNRGRSQSPDARTPALAAPPGAAGQPPRALPAAATLPGNQAPVGNAPPGNAQ